MMKTTIPILLFLLIATCIVCCGKGKSPTEDAPPAPVAVEDPLPPIPGVETQPSGAHATLTQGKTTALGLVIPEGMSPAPADDKVYRFEGNFPVFQVATFIHDQVSNAKIEIEDRGYLMRRARVKAPRGGASGKELLGIRVFKGRKGGATIDMWLEREYAKNLPSKNPTPRPRFRSTMSASEKERRGREAGKTMRVMKKVTSDQYLDEEDRNSPFFD